MKRLSLKATSLILALVLALSLSVTAFADDNAASMTRAEVTQEVIKNMGLSAQAEASAKEASAFKDVAESSKYEGVINLAYSKGIVNGVSKDTFAPDAAVTQLEAAAMVLRSTGLDKALLSAWPADYDDMAIWSGLMDGLTYEAAKPVTMVMLEQMLKNAATIADKPVIGISWSYNGQNYDSHKTIFKTVGAIPVELDQVTSTAVKYDAEGKIESAYLEESGMLKQEYADKVKEKDLTASNVGAVMQAIDGVFFTGGEDVSPSLFKVPEKEKNEGEEINATRDISDYMLMAYCLEKDVPTFAVCRGEQMMSIVSGCTFIQDIPNYYKEQGKTYNDTHRMPADAPDRTYARHDVTIDQNASKWLYKIVGSTELKNVSSWHHQAVGGVEGTNLTVVSTATYDGVEVIEAVERQDKTFCLGVQFHPENDCKFVLYTKTPEKALCDYETCLNFFRTLVEYAGK